MSGEAPIAPENGGDRWEELVKLVALVLGKCRFFSFFLPDEAGAAFNIPEASLKPTRFG